MSCFGQRELDLAVSRLKHYRLKALAAKTHAERSKYTELHDHWERESNYTAVSLREDMRKPRP